MRWTSPGDTPGSPAGGTAARPCRPCRPCADATAHSINSRQEDTRTRTRRSPLFNILTFAFLLRIITHDEGPMLPLTKRQREILDYLNEFISQHGYAPSLEEIGRRFGLSSLATVHKHLTNLQEKGFIKR